jgi:lysozyme
MNDPQVAIPAPQPPPKVKGKPWLGLAASAITIACVFAIPHEGTVYHAYPDPVSHGKPYTICNGHTQGVKPGDTATQEQCDSYLKMDMRSAAAVVSNCIHTPMNVNQAAALYYSAFNLGPQIVCGSTLQLYANGGNLIAACNQLPRWNKGAGVVWPGLTKLRMDTRELCLYPPATSQMVYPNRTRT